jgi:hypothetical protein
MSHGGRDQGVAGHVEDNGLKAVLPSGIGFHNASLSAADRTAVEQLFLNGDLLVLIETLCPYKPAIGMLCPGRDACKAHQYERRISFFMSASCKSLGRYSSACRQELYAIAVTLIAQCRCCAPQPHWHWA